MSEMGQLSAPRFEREQSVQKIALAQQLRPGTLARTADWSKISRTTSAARHGRSSGGNCFRLMPTVLALRRQSNRGHCFVSLVANREPPMVRSPFGRLPPLSDTELSPEFSKTADEGGALSCTASEKLARCTGPNHHRRYRACGVCGFSCAWTAVGRPHASGARLR